MYRGAWGNYSSWGHKESDSAEQLTLLPYSIISRYKIMAIFSCFIQCILAAYLFNTLEFVSINPIPLICPSLLFLTFGNHSFIFQYVSLFDYIARLFAQWHSTLCGPMDCSLPGSSVRGKNTKVGCHLLLQGSSQPNDQIHVSHVSPIGRQILYP